MAAPSIAFTARYVAEKLGANQDLIEEIAAMEMEPEDGRLSILDSDDDAPAITAFTRFGIECLQELLAEHAANGANHRPDRQRPSPDGYVAFRPSIISTSGRGAS